MGIVLEDVSKSYGEKRVLSHFSCTSPQGSSCAVMAPSGRGKTTLLRLILNLEKPDGGNITGVPPEKSVLFQEDRLFLRLPPEKNLTMAVPKCSREQAVGVLRELNLEDCIGIPVCRLSGGQARSATLLALDQAWQEGRGGTTFQLPGSIMAHLKGGSIRFYVEKRQAVRKS